MRYFIDCEFDGYRGALISMALVREDGRSLYFIIESADEVACDPWVSENVVPILKDCPEPPHVWAAGGAAAGIAQFMEGDEGPHIVADWPDDLRHFCDLMVNGPGVMAWPVGFTMEVKRVDAYPSKLVDAVQHNAWWDAIALRQKVLELEDAEGKPTPAALVFQIGDVVYLSGAAQQLTVTEMDDDRFGVGVAWFAVDGAMHKMNVPAAALRRWVDTAPTRAPMPRYSRATGSPDDPWR